MDATTSFRINYLNDTKKLIKEAIEYKGVEVPEGTAFRDYVKLIRDIDGYIDDGSFTWDSFEDYDTNANVSDKLLYLNETKEYMKLVLESKGVTVPYGTDFREYAELIKSIQNKEEFFNLNGLMFEWNAKNYSEDETVLYDSVKNVPMNFVNAPQKIDTNTMKIGSISYAGVYKNGYYMNISKFKDNFTGDYTLEWYGLVPQYGLGYFFTMGVNNIPSLTPCLTLNADSKSNLLVRCAFAKIEETGTISGIRYETLTTDCLTETIGHIVVTANASTNTYTIYINGELRGSFSSVYLDKDYNHVFSKSIDRICQIPTDEYPPSGSTVKRIRLYNIVKTEEEIQVIYEGRDN